MSSPQTVDELRAKITERGPWFDVPAGTPVTYCERCDADGLYWIRTKPRPGKPNGAHMLVDVTVNGGVVPGFAENGQVGRGVSHFATCPHAAHFSRRSPS